MSLFRRKSQRKPELDYTPPLFSEFRAIVGKDFADFQTYEFMCTAMQCKVYDRAECFERLHEIAESQKEMEKVLERINAPSQSD